MSEQIKVYNEEGTLVAVNMETIIIIMWNKRRTLSESKNIN